MKWRQERHVTISLASDASNFGWGGAILDSKRTSVKEVGDAWDEVMLPKPIHVKETIALTCTLQALKDFVRNSRIDVLVDNMILIGCWERQYAGSHDMLQALKELFWTTVELNVVISLCYISSLENLADAPSRRLSQADCSLSECGPEYNTCLGARWAILAI